MVAKKELDAAIHLECYHDPEDDYPPAQVETQELTATYQGEQYIIGINDSATIGDLRWRLGRKLNTLPSWLRIVKDGEEVDDHLPCQQFREVVLSIEARFRIFANPPPPASSTGSSSLRLRGGAGSGNSPTTADALLHDDEVFRGALQRALPVCRRLRKPQVKILLRCDPSLQKRIQAADDASIIKMVEAAAKRVGMTMLDTPQRPQSAKPAVRFQDSDSRSTSPSLKRRQSENAHQPPSALKHAADKNDTSQSDQGELVVADGQFNVPFRPTLRPGENGVILLDTIDDLVQYRKRMATSGGISAALLPVRGDENDSDVQEVYIKMHRKRDGDVLSTHMAAVFMHRLGSQMPKRTTSQQPPRITSQRASCVIGLELEASTSHKALWRELSASPPDMKEVLSELRKLSFKAVSDGDLIDTFLPHKRSDVVRCLVRVASPSKESLLRLSGRNSLFFSPPSSELSMYPIVWYQRTQVANLDEACRLHDTVPQALGVACRRHQTLGVTFGIRTTQVHRDMVATALGKLPGERYLLHNVPPDWDSAELKELCTTMGWAAEPVPHSQRVKRSAATWTMRAVKAPALDSITVVTDADVEIVVRITKPSPSSSASSSSAARTTSSGPRRAQHERGGPTWASIVAQPAREPSVQKSTKASTSSTPPPMVPGAPPPPVREPEESEAKRRRSESPTPRLAQEVASAPLGVVNDCPVPPPPLGPPPPASSTPAPDIVVGTLKDLMHQMTQMQNCMQGMHEQVMKLSTKVGQLDENVNVLNEIQANLSPLSALDAEMADGQPKSIEDAH